MLIFVLTFHRTLDKGFNLSIFTDVLFVVSNKVDYSIKTGNRCPDVTQKGIDCGREEVRGCF